MTYRRTGKSINTEFPVDIDDERGSTASRNSRRTLIQLDHSCPFSPSKAPGALKENDESLREVSGDEIFLFLLNQRRQDLESQSPRTRLENTPRLPAHFLIAGGNHRNQSQFSTMTASPSGASSVMSDVSSISAYSFRSEHHNDCKVKSPQRIQISRKQHFTDAEQLKSHLSAQYQFTDTHHEVIDSPMCVPGARKRSVLDDLDIRAGDNPRAANDAGDVPAALDSWGEMIVPASSAIAEDDKGPECEEPSTATAKKKKKRFSFLKKLVPNFLRFRRRSVSLPLSHSSSYTAEHLEEGKDEQEQHGRASMLSFAVRNILQPRPRRQAGGDYTKKKSSPVVTRRTTF